MFRVTLNIFRVALKIFRATLNLSWDGPARPQGNPEPEPGQSSERLASP